ncbi:MAG: hypothetical protein VYC34_11335 [Planctomycetota bacterium]|nr:hypothetical protein [Planctomycetota bacterium]
MDGMNLEAARAEQMARAMFQRVLKGWAMDALALRQSGLDRPSVRGAIAPASPWSAAAFRKAA